MKHKGTKTIHTDRLLLRRFYIGDADAMYRNWAGDPEVTRYLSWPRHQSPVESVRVIKLWEPDMIQRDHYHWCIELKAIGEAIGSIAANTVNDEIEAVEIGYALGRHYWGQGIMTEALSAVIRFFFEEVSALRIEARHDTENIASGKVMLNCGMTPEGILRQAGKNNFGIRDIRVCSILKAEYEANKGIHT